MENHGIEREVYTEVWDYIHDHLRMTIEDILILRDNKEFSKKYPSDLIQDIIENIMLPYKN